MGSLDEGVEDGAGERALVVAALGMPLDSEDEVVGRVKFDGFNDLVLGRDGGDQEVVAGGLDGLVVAGVDVFG